MAMRRGMRCYRVQARDLMIVLDDVNARMTQCRSEGYSDAASSLSVPELITSDIGKSGGPDSFLRRHRQQSPSKLESGQLESGTKGTSGKL